MDSQPLDTREVPGTSFVSALIPFMTSLLSCPCQISKTPPPTPPTNAVIPGVRISAYRSGRGGDRNIQAVVTSLTSLTTRDFMAHFPKHCQHISSAAFPVSPSTDSAPDLPSRSTSLSLVCACHRCQGFASATAIMCALGSSLLFIQSLTLKIFSSSPASLSYQIILFSIGACCNLSYLKK